MTTYRTRQFKKEDFTKILEVEPRFEEFLTAFNQQSKVLESILNGGIGADNLNVRTVEVSVSPSQKFPLTVAGKVSGKPRGARVVRCVKTTTNSGGDPSGVAVGVDWTTNGADLVVNGFPGLSNADSYRVTLEIVGG